MIKAFLPLLMLFTLIGLQAQNSRDSAAINSLILNFGINQIKENNIHPKVHSGTNFIVAYSNSKHKKNVSIIDFSASFSRPKTEHESAAYSINVNAVLGYSYLFESGSYSSGFSHLFGPKAALVYNVSHYPNWDDSHLYWANSLDFGIRNLFYYHFPSKNKLIFDIGFDVLGFFSRPEIDRQYKIDDLSFGGIMNSFHSDIEFGTLNKTIGISCVLEYNINLTQNYAQSIFYSFCYNAIDSRISDRFQINIHAIGLKFHFL